MRVLKVSNTTRANTPPQTLTTREPHLGDTPPPLFFLGAQYHEERSEFERCHH